MTSVWVEAWVPVPKSRKMGVSAQEQEDGCQCSRARRWVPVLKSTKRAVPIVSAVQMLQQNHPWQPTRLLPPFAFPVVGKHAYAGMRATPFVYLSCCDAAPRRTHPHRDNQAL